MEHIVSNMGIKSTLRFLIHHMTYFSEYKPKLDYFPVNGKIHNSVDEDIKEMTNEEIDDGQKIDDLADSSCIDFGTSFRVNTIHGELKTS